MSRFGIKSAVALDLEDTEASYIPETVLSAAVASEVRGGPGRVRNCGTDRQLRDRMGTVEPQSADPAPHVAPFAVRTLAESCAGGVATGARHRWHVDLLASRRRHHGDGPRDDVKVRAATRPRRGSSL